MMRKSYLVLLPFVCGLQIVSAPLSAAAYEYRYHTNAPEVQVDPSVLGEGAAQPDQDETAQPRQAQQPVPSAETTPAAPVAPVEAEPAQPELKKPFFAAVPLAVPPPLPPVAQQQFHPSVKHAPAPIAQKKLAAPLFTAPPTLPAAPSEEAAMPVKPLPPVAPAIPPAPPVTAAPATARKNIQWAAPAAVPVIAKPATEDKAPVAVLTPEEKKPLVPAPEAATAATTTAPATEKTAAAMPETKPDTTPVVMGPSDLTLNFDTTSSKLSAQEQSKLDGMVKQLNDEANMRLQIRGFARGDASDQSSARRMALARALGVRSYLMDKGIKPVRIDVRALGSETDRMPIDRVDLVLEK